MADSSSRVLAVQPTLGWMSLRLSRIIAFGFGSGLIKPAPGTWGTLLAWLLWQPISTIESPMVISVFLLAAFGLGVWACDRVGRELGVPDYGGMVWDEFVAFWCVLWVIPDTVMAQAFGFVLFRLFDIYKPPPISYFDRHMKNGLGVMWDDIIAMFYAVLVFALFNRLFEFLFD